MSCAAAKADHPNLNRRERKRMMREQNERARFEAAVNRRDGFEMFSDPSYYDMICLRPEGSREFSNTVHVARHEHAEDLLSWIAGRLDIFPDHALLEGSDPTGHGRSLLEQWRLAGSLQED